MRDIFIQLDEIRLIEHPQQRKDVLNIDVIENTAMHKALCAEIAQISGNLKGAVITSFEPLIDGKNVVGVCVGLKQGKHNCNVVIDMPENVDGNISIDVINGY